MKLADLIVWTPGVRFAHARWYDEKLEPAQCRVVEVKRDAYKGEPIDIVSVEEIGGSRRATYRSSDVPWRGLVLSEENSRSLSACFGSAK